MLIVAVCTRDMPCLIPCHVQSCLIQQGWGAYQAGGCSWQQWMHATAKVCKSPMQG